MTSFKSFTSLVALALAAGSATIAHASPTYTAAFQGVTFTFVQRDTDTLTFEIQNANSATGDWSGTQYLAAFDLKDLGENFSATSAILNGPGATNLPGENSQLSAMNIGCSGRGSPPGSICFNLAPDVSLTSDMMYTIDFSSPLDIAALGPHLQIAFTNVQGGSKVGSLYSQNVPQTTRNSSSSGGSSGSSGGSSSSGSSGGPVGSSGGLGGSSGGPGGSSGGRLPEPGTLLLFAIGAIAAGLQRVREARSTAHVTLGS